jgi:ribosomal protein S27E
MKQKTELTFEVEETIILRQGGHFITVLCPRCHMMVDMVSPHVLSVVTGASEREIFRLVETGAIYFVEASPLVACPVCCRNIVEVE